MGSLGAPQLQPSTAAPVLFDQDTVSAVFEQASPAVVEIYVTERGGRSGLVRGQGSGFLVDSQGHIVTNNHVIEGATSLTVIFKDGKTTPGTVLGTDPSGDLAVVKVSEAAVSGIAPLAIRDSSTVKVGEMAIAIGSPYGYMNTVTVGVVSGLGRSLGGLTRNGSRLSGLIQTDAALNPGNSGGPLLDAQGQVIGVNSAIDNTDDARSIGFAVPSSLVTTRLPGLISGKTYVRPWLGITGTALNEQRAQELGLTVDEGVYVLSVIPDGPAAKAGIKGSGTDATGAPLAGGDIITRADAKAVDSVEALSAYLATKEVGDRVELSVLRGGETVKVTATLEAWPERLPAFTVEELPSPTHPPIP
jgi:2-alkenal reductase